MSAHHENGRHFSQAGTNIAPQVMVSGGVTMPLIRWKPLDNNASFMYGMDPVFEDYLAQQLSSWPQPEEIELAPDQDEMESEPVPQLSYVLALT
jgi:hypothetical protein